MRHEPSNGFSFELPDGWHRDEHNLPITFLGPEGSIGSAHQVIQLYIGGILPQYHAPEARQEFLSEPGATVSRTIAGGERNAVVLKKQSNSEMSIVRNGIHYSLVYGHDPETLRAMELVRETTLFPTEETASSELRRWADPKVQAIMRMLDGKAPVPAPQPSTPQREKPRGFLNRLFGRVEKQQIFTYKQAATDEIEFVKNTIRGNPQLYGTTGGILAQDPTDSANFSLLVYDFERYNFIFSITQEHLGTPEGVTAFREMAAQGNVGILDFLIKKGMDVNARNERGVTALAIAITRGQAEAVSFLLGSGADPNLIYFDTFASLQQAIEQYLLGQDQRNSTMVSTYKQIIDSLLSHGADIEQAKRLSARAGTARISEYLRQL